MTIKIGVISDTHLRRPTQELSKLLSDVFADVSMILHAGDITELEVLRAFSERTLVAVTGNMDSYAVRERLPPQRVVEVGGFRIGLTHILGKASRLGNQKAGPFDGVDAIVYGHTHRPDNHVKDGILFFNPGAFSGGFPSVRRSTAGILTLGKEIEGNIVRV